MQDSAARPSDRWIPWYIVGFFIFFIVVLAGFSWLAFHTYTGQVTVDAYKKGLAYNRAIASAEAQTRLNWKGILQATPHAGAVDITFELKDANGHLVSDANVIARLSRSTQAGYDVEITLHYDKGLYRGTAMPELPGTWNIRISATRNGHNYQQSKNIVLQ